MKPGAISKRILFGLAFLLVIVLFLPSRIAAAPSAALPAKGSPAPQGPASAVSRPSPAKPAVVQASFRPLNFALIRGGFTSTDQFFQAVKADPVLHAFYGDCSDPQATMKPLSEDILVFSTFRRGNEIKWARQPLLVHKGEYVLTFCGKTVLARCGNLVSWSPMQPSESIPPSLLEIPADLVKDPLTPAPAVASSQVLPGGALAAAAPAVASASHHGFFFIPPIYIPSSSSSSHGPSPAPLLGLEGDEFTGYQALIPLFVGLFVIALLKLVTR